MDVQDEDLRLALELSLVESFQAPGPGPATPLRSGATGARPNTQIVAGRDDEEMATILRRAQEELVEEEERITRLAQRESEREHQELLEQRALQRALQRSSSNGRLSPSTPPSSPSFLASSSSSSSSATTLSEVRQWTTDDVCAWLEREGLGRHVKAFRGEVVDGPTLLEIGDAELSSCLGVPLGHRRRILRFTAAARLHELPSPNQLQSHHQPSRPQPLHQQLHFQPQRQRQQRQQSPHQQQRQRERAREREAQERERERREREERERREKDACLARALQEEEDTLLAQQLELESSLEAEEVMDLTALQTVSTAAAPPVPAPIMPPRRVAPTRPAPPLPLLWSLAFQGLAQAPQNVAAEDHMSYEDLVSLPNVTVGVRDINRLPTMTFRAGMACEPSCVICMCDYTPGDTLRRMECMHVFHKECIDKWLQQSKKCPSCNREMDL